jgi:hypothetical protein
MGTLSDPDSSPQIADTRGELTAALAPHFPGRPRRERSDLPITRDLTLAYALSLVIALLTCLAALVGLLAGSHIYPAAQLSGNTGTDALTLVLDLPLLLGSMWLARLGSLVGLLCWPGALFYLVYIYTFYLFAVPFNALFLPYALLVTLSAYTLMYLIASMRSGLIRERLGARVPARTIGGALVAIALLFTVVDTIMIGAALTSSAAVDATTHASWIVDFVIELPALLLAGMLLWRRQALGYVTAPWLLLQGALLNAGYAVVLALQAIVGAANINAPFVAIVFVIGALSFTLLAFFVRGAASEQASAPIEAKEGGDHAEAGRE